MTWPADALVEREQAALIGDAFFRAHFERVLQLVRERGDHPIRALVGIERGPDVAEAAGAGHPRQLAGQVRSERWTERDVDDHVAGFEAIDQRAEGCRA